MFRDAQQRFERGERVVRSPRRAPHARDNLLHTPPVEQLKHTPVPIFVAHGPVEAASMRIAYRSLGMSRPRTEAMQRSDEGFRYLIPCDEVLEPSLEYVIFASNEAGEPVGTFGSVAQPAVVPIVETRKQPAPSFPGELPPKQCDAERSCILGTEGCELPLPPEQQLGEVCDAARVCAEGLSCQSGKCLLTKLAEKPLPALQEPPRKLRFYADLSIGVSWAYLKRRASADRLPSERRVDDLRTRELDDEAARAELFDAGWDCDVATAPGAVDATNCGVAVSNPGLVAVPVVNALVGYRITRRISVAATTRLQLARGNGPLAGSTLGIRGEYLLTQPTARGFAMHALLGVGVGTLQAKPRVARSVRGDPFASSANIGQVGVALNTGVRALYRFNRWLGVSLAPAVQLGLPNALWALDVLGGCELSF